jgi:serpin B
MKRQFSLLAAAVATLFTAGGALFAEDASDETASVAPVVVSEDADFAERQLAFTLNVFQRSLENDAQDENTLVAPFSVYRSLAALSLGSAQKTKAEIDAALFRSDLDDARWQEEFGAVDAELSKAPEATLTGGLWCASDMTLRKEFAEGLAKLSRQETTTFDFAQADACEKINDWFAEKTQGRVSNLLTSIDPMSRMLLADATTFKGEWQSAFSPKSTSEGVFTDLKEQEFKFPLMSQTNEFLYVDAEAFQYLEAPYQDERFSFVVVLPKKDESYAEVEQSLTPALLLDCRKRATKTKIEFRLPKFSVKRSFDLGATLKKAGVVDAFALSADLTPIAGDANLRLDRATQGAFLAVDEAGAIAAAATATTFIPKSADLNLTKFHADRPFFYFIRHNGSGAVLFAGRFVSPEKAGGVKVETEEKVPNSDSHAGGSLR